jgi:uncharacterized protein (TIGR03435 family)
MKRPVCLFVHLLTIAVGAAMAQSDARPEFEVAAIKSAAPDARGTWVRTVPGGRISITNMTLKELVEIAWRIQPFQISGGPPWLDSARYDINAKPEHKPTNDELQQMLQSLLKDRFQLALRRETKELPVYALVLARKDGKLGPGLVETKEGSCEPLDPNKPLPPPVPGKRPNFCGFMRFGRGDMIGVGVPLENFTNSLSRNLNRTVIDKTGLKGRYDIKMEWTPEQPPPMQMPEEQKQSPSAGATGPSIFTAIHEQLGLKLESQKGPVDVFIVERAEKPSEN